MQVAKRFREEIGERVRIWHKLNQDDDFAFLTNTNTTSTVLMAQDVLIQLMPEQANAAVNAYHQEKIPDSRGGLPGDSRA